MYMKQQAHTNHEAKKINKLVVTSDKLTTNFAGRQLDHAGLNYKLFVTQTNYVKEGYIGLLLK
jgi:hypothetical protein